MARVPDAATTPDPQLFARDEFIATRWRYWPGEHVTLLGPTKSGKTTLAFQLLQRSATPKLPAVVLAMKPRDDTVKNWSAIMELKTVRSWPPLPTPLTARPRGWVLWPKHSFDPDKDDPMMYRLFRKAILDCYKRGNRILFADELYGLCEELKLSRELITVWSRGRSMGCGLWGGTQRPAHVPLWAYSQAEHLFLAYEPDKVARKRYAEIGGIIDPAFVEYHVLRLQRHQWLYIRRDGPAYCVVDR